MTFGVLTHQRLISAVVAIDYSLTLLKWAVRREPSEKRALRPRPQCRNVLASETHGVAMLTELGGERAGHDAGLALLQTQAGTIHGAGGVGQRLSEFLHRLVVLRERHRDILLATDLTLSGKTPPQRVEGVPHVHAARVAQVAASLVFSEIDQYQLSAWSQLARPS